MRGSTLLFSDSLSQSPLIIYFEIVTHLTKVAICNSTTQNCSVAKLCRTKILVRSRYLLTWKRRDEKCPLVKRFNSLLEATESINELNLHVVEKILSLSLKQRVFQFIEYDNNVSRLNTRLLVGLIRETNLLSVLHTYDT